MPHSYRRPTLSSKGFQRQDQVMTELNITEAGSVQFPMVRHAAEIGWTPLPPQDALRKRGGETGLLFRDELERVLGRFNSWMTDDAIRAVVERLEAIPPTIEGNREMLAWLRGERQWYDEAEKRSRTRPAHRLRCAQQQHLPRHLGMEAQATGAKRQPCGRDVRCQRRAGRHRRA